MTDLKDDNQLALLAARGDGDAFQCLLERHYDMMFRVAYRFCSHREEAEDIAQDVCLSLPSRLKHFEGRSAFSTWLYRVVVNRAKDAARKASSLERLHSEYGEVEDLARGDAIEANKQSQWLSEILAELSDDLKETAILVVGEEMTQHQAAEVLGVKEGTIAWRMSELKKVLRIRAKEEA